MTISLLATLIFCGLIVLPLGAVIYLFNHIKTRNPYRSKGIYNPYNGSYSWPLIFLRPGMGNPAADLREGERFGALMEAGKQRRSKNRRAR